MTYTDDRPPLVEEPPTDPYLDRPVEPRGDVPPHDRAAEQAVLGAAMTIPGAVDALGKHLTGADFWQPAHEAVWRAVTHLHAAGNPTSPTAVAAHLADVGDLHRLVGGAPYIHTLQSAAPASIDEAVYYAHRVDTLARKRAAIQRTEQTLNRLRTATSDEQIDHALHDVADHFSQTREDLANPPHTTTWSPVDLEPVLAGEHLDPPPTMLMRNDGVFLLYDGAVHTIAGESESGKTWLCLLAALQLLREGCDVVFLDFEDRADRVIGRLLALGATFDELRAHFSYVRPDRPLDEDGRSQLAPHLTAARLVILDGVTEAMTTHGFDLNSNEDSAKFQAMLPRWIADHGPAVAMIDHVVKDKEKQDRFALGAQHKLAGIDGAAYMVKTIQPFGRGKRGLARVEVSKDRPGHVREHTHGRTIAEFALDATRNELVLTAELVPPGNVSGRAGDTFEPTVLMEKISRYVQINPGMSKKAIEGAMNGKATTIRLALELLVTRGYINVETGARGAVKHQHFKSYYADPDREPDEPLEAPDEDPSDEPDYPPDDEPDTPLETPSEPTEETP